MTDQTSPSRQRMRDGTELREMLDERREGKGRSDRPSMQPGSTYEAVTRQMVDSLRDEVRDVKSRINQLIMILVGAIAAEVLARFIGIGL